MENLHYLLLLTLLALTSSLVASAYDPSPLQDFCVAVTNPADGVLVNGKFCKDPKQVKADDFFFTGLNKPGNTAATPQGSAATQVFVDPLPGLNTLGISLARLDFAPYGLNPLQTHPRGSEILVVVDGCLFVGFVASNQNNNTLFTKVLNPGDVFVIPIGQIHFELNIGKGNAFAFVAYSSQNPGVITIANAVFGSKPPISADLLAKAFQVDKSVINYLQKQLS